MNPLGVVASLLLYAVALGLFLVEVFLPTGGIIGLVATGCVSYSLYSLFVGDYTALAVFLIVFTCIYVPVSFFWGVRRMRHSTNLSGADSTGEDIREAESLIGQSGEAASDLRPAGIATIAGRRFQVVSGGRFIEAGTTISVVEVSGNRIVVKKD